MARTLENAIIGAVRFEERQAPPNTPEVGFSVLYVDNSGFHFRTGNGDVYDLSASLHVDPPVEPALLWEDTFTRLDASSLGNGWVYDAGILMGISGNLAVSLPAWADGPHMVLNNGGGILTADDYIIEAVFDPSCMDNSVVWGVVWRAEVSPVFRGYGIFFNSGGMHLIRLPGWNQIDEWGAPSTWGEVHNHTVRIEVTGGNFKLIADGAEIRTMSDPLGSYSTGRYFGLCGNAAGGDLYKVHRVSLYG